MEIIHLRGTAPEPWALDLSPRLTIVHGLTEPVATAVRRAVDALVKGRARDLVAGGVTGKVSVGGEALDLDQVEAQLRDLVPAAMLTAADVADPGAALVEARQRALDDELARASEALQTAEAELVRVRADWHEALGERTDTMRAGLRDRDAAAVELAAARQRMSEAPSPEPDEPTPTGAGSGGPDPELARLIEERAAAAHLARDAAAAAVQEATAARDRLAAARPPDADVDARRFELADAEARTAVAPGDAAPEEERRSLAEQRAVLAAQLEGIEVRSTERVAAALEASEAHGGIVALEAARVAVEWERVRDLVADDDVAWRPSPPGSSPLDAEFGVGGVDVEPEALAEVRPSGIFSRPPVVQPDDEEPGIAEPEERSEVSVATPVSPALEARVDDARKRVSRARRALDEASGATRLDPADVEALEACHAEVLGAWEGSERRIGVGRARRRLEEAQLAEREILARMGFASYTEFMVSGRSSGLPSQPDTDHARRGLAEAEASLRDAEADVEAELSASTQTQQAPPRQAPQVADEVREAETAAATRRALEEARKREATEERPPAETWDPGAAKGRLVATLEALTARAAELLGTDPGDEVANALRDRIATDPLPDLRLALDEVGVPLGEVLTRDEVLSRARAWIARQGEAAVRRRSLIAERVEVEARLAELDAADGARVAYDAATRDRDDLRQALADLVAIDAALDATQERLAHNLDDLARATAALAEAEQAQHPVTIAAEPSPTESDLGPADDAMDPEAGDTGAGDGVDVDLPQLEAEVRNAQTALEAAVARLLPSPSATGEADADADAAVGRAEARVVLARLELDGLQGLQTARGKESAPAHDAMTPDVDGVIWRILARLASLREAAAPSGPGPTPLVLDDPFGRLDDEAAVRVCESLSGPALTVQTVVLTDRPGVVEWARRSDPRRVQAVTATSTSGDPPPA